MTVNAALLDKPTGSAADIPDVLKRFVRKRGVTERCDLCATDLAESHQHLLRLPERSVQCSCDACAILFSDGSDGRFRRIPRDVVKLEGAEITDLQWASLLLPIQLVFFFQNSSNGRVSAMYPSPAGATESQLDLDGWGEIVRANPRLVKMQPDVEALLVNRTGGRHEQFIAPIDECFRLVGLIRSKWRGLSGGSDVWSTVNEFFDGLIRRAVVVTSER